MPCPERTPDRVNKMVTDAFRRYGKDLHAYLRRRLRLRRREADDLAQEVYERFLRTDQNKVVENPQAYLYGIAGNVLLHFWEREKKAGERFETVEPASLGDLSTFDGGNEDFDRLNLQQQWQAALAQLPEVHARIFLHIKGEGLTYAETGKHMNLTPKAVERYFCEAKARLAMLSWDR